MSRKVKIMMLTILVIIGFTGCGTLSNLKGKRWLVFREADAGGPHYYGGVTGDIQSLGEAFIFFPFFLPDIAICIATDTITLPVVAYKRSQKPDKEDNGKKEGEKERSKFNPGRKRKEIID